MLKIQNLKQRLHKIEEITNDPMWIKGLGERKKKEMEFHDPYREESRTELMDKDSYKKFYGNTKYYIATESARTYLDDWIEKHANDKIFLDYACGNGSIAIKAAKAGARLAIGIDVSPISVEKSKRNAIEAGVKDNTHFIKIDCENTMLPDNSIDIIICCGALHHLNLLYAFPELGRILAPGGRILAYEALNYNPAIKLYRYLTPAMRTDWERTHILNLRDVKLAKGFFNLREIRYFCITSIMAAYSKPLLPLFNLVDYFLTKIPIIKLMSWIFVFELISKENS
ncbi:MAG TPA: class I SAM-dependent methyltransferase [Candidatus Scalindua sp.]|nr:class I SAM-dependent methyltransferase [Candidatus Scalindua sp.]